MGTQRLDFAEFYRESKDECLFAVLVSVGDQDTAQDLVAEAFARAWASWRTVSKHPAPAAWVVRTALNANVSRWRRRRREIVIPDPGLVADLAAADGRADDSVDPRIMAALMRLPARQRQVVALRLLLDLDTNRTARILGVAPGTVQAHLVRGDGLPAVVDFNGQPSPACQLYPPISRALALRIVQPQRSGARTGGTVLIIHPPALPSGAGVQIATTVSPGHIHVSIDLVYARPQCTG